MPPPPATPTPHRFLVPKRSQPGSDTPKPAFQASSQQFRATPRFSLQSASRAVPSPSLTRFHHRGSGRDVVIDSSPPPLPETGDIEDSNDDFHAIVDDEYEGRRLVYEGDTLIEEDDMVYESSPVRAAVSDDGDGDGDGDGSDERWAKRRRVSASPPCPWVDRSSPFLGAQHEADTEMHDTVLEIESSFPAAPLVSSNAVESDTEVPGDVEVAIGSTPNAKEKHPKPHQPTFQKAPRFKPTETSEGAFHSEPLPDAFSPRRKGPKYVAGGLAAEVRNWLVDVEAGIGSGSMTSSTANHDEEWAARIQVDELRGGARSARGMTLVLGRQVSHGKSIAADGGESREATDKINTNAVKLILAGPGRLSGLGIGNDVKPGVILGIARPTWEVVLDDLGRWCVACDWAVLR